MEIRASCTLDLKTMQAVTRAAMFRKADPKKRLILWTTVYGILIAILVWECIAFGPSATLFATIALAAVICMLGAFLYFITPRIQYNALAQMKDILNTYTFREDALCIVSKGAAYNGEAVIQYPMIVRVMETKAYFFIFQNKNQLFPVDKSTLTGGSAEDIRNKLAAAISGKYIVCKY